MSKEYDAIIIGAGVIGASVAKEMSAQGYKTLSIDKLPEAGYGSTSGSCAIIRTYYSAFETCALAYESWFYWKDWNNYIGTQDESGLIEYHDIGCLVIKTEQNDQLENVCEMMDQVGCPYDDLKPNQINNIMSGVDTQMYYPPKRPGDEGFCEPTGPSVSGAVFFPRGGYVSDPKLAAHNVQRSAEALGAEFLFNTEVTEILQENECVSGVKLSDGTVIKAPVVVNVAGPHSFVINKMAGVEDDMKISTRALRHEVAHVPAPESLDYDEKGFIYSDSDIYTYARPEVGNNILIGSEDPKCDIQEFVDDPDDFDDNVSEQTKIMAMRLAQRIPDLGIPEQANGLVALYDVTEDWMPIYDKSSLFGFYMAIGTSGNQFKNAPVVGKLMTKLIQDIEGGQDHDNNPVKFHLENIDKNIDLGAFSRNREINQNSSFSVIG